MDADLRIGQLRRRYRRMACTPAVARREVPYFDFLRQAHAINTQWAEDLIRRSTDVDPRAREKARFYLRQISSALSPSNFLATNPELIKETWATSGENLARGAELLAKDIEAGMISLDPDEQNGDLIAKIRALVH